MASTTNKKTLMDSALQDFRERTESYLPLRNCSNFYSDTRFREMTVQEKDRILDKYTHTPFKFLFREILCSEIDKIVEQLRKKNKEHRQKFESLMESIIDCICAMHKNVLVAQMEIGQEMAETFFERRKQEAFRSFQDCWNWHPGNREFHDVQKEKLERKLDLIRVQIRGDRVDAAEETPVPNLRSCQKNGASGEAFANVDLPQPQLEKSDTTMMAGENKAVSSNIPVLETHVQNYSTGNDVNSSSLINPAAMSTSDPDLQAGNEDETPIISQDMQLKENDAPRVAEKTKAISSAIPVWEDDTPVICQDPPLQSLRRSSRVKFKTSIPSPTCSIIVPRRRRRKIKSSDQHQCLSTNPAPGPSSLPMAGQENSTSLHAKIVMNPESCSEDLTTSTITPNPVLAHTATTAPHPEKCLRRSSRLKDFGRPNDGPQRSMRKVVAEHPRSSSNETLSSQQNSGGNQVAPMPSTSTSHGRNDDEAQKSNKKRPTSVLDIEIENRRSWDKYPVTGTVHYPNYIEFLGWAHPLFQCNFCKKKFKTKSCLKNHGKDICMKRDKFYKCSQCQESFTVRKHFESHIRSHPGLKPFTCEECNRGFVTCEKLICHKNIHIGSYACGQCSKTFSSNKDLCRHLVIHSGQYPYKCSICGSQWRRKDNLDRHLKKLHKKPKEVSKKLADKAAVAYLRMNVSQENIPVKQVNSAVFASVLKNANLIPSRAHSVRNRRKMRTSGSGSVTRSDLCSSAPPPNPEPDGENDIEVAVAKIMQIYDMNDFKQEPLESVPESETEMNPSVSLSTASPPTSSV